MQLLALIALLPFLASTSAAPQPNLEPISIRSSTSHPVSFSNVHPPVGEEATAVGYFKRDVVEHVFTDLNNPGWTWVQIINDHGGAKGAATTQWVHRYGNGPAPRVSASATAGVSASGSGSGSGTVRPASVSSSAKSTAVSTSKTSSVVSKSSSSASKVSSSASKVSTSASKSSSSASQVSSSASKSSSSASKSSSSASKSSSSASKSSSSASKVSSSASKSSSSAAVPTSTSNADRDKFLSLHNTFRAKYGAAALSWDADLAAYAQRTAQTCKYGHTGGPNGENIAAGVGGGYKIEAAFNSWAKEAVRYDYSKPGYSSSTGHFTQIVWKGTTKVGCAAVTSCADGTIFTGYKQNSTYVVCEYQAPGNIYDPSSAANSAQFFKTNVGVKI